MIKIEVYLSDHHVGSAGELARIIATNFPVMLVKRINGSEVKRFEFGTVDVPHSCDHCKADILDAITET